MLTWLTNQPQRDYADTLEVLFNKYIPDVLEFIHPVLATSGSAKKSEPPGSTVSMSERVCQSQLEPQDVMLSEVHLINTSCQILEVQNVK